MESAWFRAIVMELCGLGSWRASIRSWCMLCCYDGTPWTRSGLCVGWRLAHVRKMALAIAIFAIGVAACNGKVLRGVGWALSFCSWGLSS